MNKIKLFIITVLILLLTACKPHFNTSDYLKEKIDLDVSKCIILRDNDDHNIFGLGETIIELNCKYDRENIEKQIKNYNKLPLSDNLQYIMYKEEKEEENEELYHLAKNNKIPEIKDGYYYFINRYNKRELKYDDKDIFEDLSLKFTLVLYDNKTSTLYYYEYDE